MTYDEAKSVFIGRWFRYNHFHFDEKFIELDFDCHDLPEPRLKFSIDYYVDRIEKGLKIPSIFLASGYKLRDGRITDFHPPGIQIIDGNHRLAAHLHCGLKSIKAIIPESHLRKIRGIK
jgi:hypothetical protein